MAYAVWLLLSILLSHGSAKHPPSCRCLSYQPCWPSTSDFAQLESQLSVPLIKPIPPASACYPPSHPSGNCAAVQEHLTDATWRSNLPGAMQILNFESYVFKNGTIDACYYNTTLGYPCEQGNIPILGVEAQKVSDIQAAVRFAKKHNLKLIIKNTGHDFLGRSAGRGGFMLWTHKLKDITYDDHFVPDGVPSTESYKVTFAALTIGAGVQWSEAYAAANASGRFILGGISGGGSVGAAGGWILGGGHSAFSAKYGLGVDNVIQFTLVLASGEYAIANDYKNSDLFWALRGGGGGTFGVIATVTYRTHEVLPFASFNSSATFATPEVAKKFMTEFIRLHPDLSDKGWGGYASWSNTSFNHVYIGPNISVLEAKETFSPFIEPAKSIAKDFQFEFGDFSSFYEFEHLFLSTPSGSGGLLELTSRLMSRKKAQEEPERVAELTLAVGVGFSQVTTFLPFVAGGAVARVDPDNVGLNPAWRKGLGVLTGGASWDEGTSAAKIEVLIRDSLDQLNNYLDKVSPDSAVLYPPPRFLAGSWLTPWNPHGIHMESTWIPCKKEISVEILPGFHGVHVDSMLSPGTFLATGKNMIYT
ncbi:FAD-binding domain-containing protein [Amanita rubescens]|nr:FAD-binding domain-containing protein [Amanita rubescens]